MHNYDQYFADNYYRNTTPSMMNNNQPNLYTPEEGYNKGNLFANLYEPYKNYQPVELKATNEQEKMFLDLSRYAFAAHELNLYLDLHPEDKTMLTLFNDYRSHANQLMTDYEKKYGPLTVSSDNMTDSFTWATDKWPREGGNS